MTVVIILTKFPLVKLQNRMDYQCVCNRLTNFYVKESLYRVALKVRSVGYILTKQNLQRLVLTSEEFVTTCHPLSFLVLQIQSLYLGRGMK